MVRIGSRAVVLWATLLLPGIVLVGLTSLGPAGDAAWVRPAAAFWFIVIVTALCFMGGLFVFALGWHHRLAEIAILGASLATESFLAMIHGLTIPGMLYDANSAVAVSVFIALPCALVAALPLVLPRVAILRRSARAWRVWSAGALVTSALLGIGMLIRPDAITAPSPGEPATVAIAGGALAGTIVLSLRHLRLYRIGGRRASLIASVGFLYVGLSTLVWLGGVPFSAGWWSAHVVDAAGVLLAAAGLTLAHRNDRSVALTLAPVVNRDPLVALELGLTPPVHRFIAALNQKDLVTRDHVVRVGELAMRVGLRAHLEPERVHTLGLAALLHDLGKLSAPVEILQKPGPLTDEEFEVMKRHTIWGAELMAGAATLAPAANLVRWHHERIDGRGYPDGLVGEAIPLETMIISVCDAWDAMTYSRPYRAGMQHAEALAILRHGAGSQWSPRAVELLAAELEAHGPVTTSVYDDVGRAAGARAEGRGEDLVGVCSDALPAVLRVEAR